MRSRLFCIQHEDTTPPGAVARWASEAGVEMVLVRPDLGEGLPAPATLTDTDMVCVLGGSMDVPDTERLPWLAQELTWVQQLVSQGEIPLLGICLGAQMIAHVSGGAVSTGPYAERGWHLLMPEDHATNAFGRHFVRGLHVFESHRQVFTPPLNAQSLASTEAWPHQAFALGDRVVAVQFHPEFDEAIVGAMSARIAAAPPKPEWDSQYVTECDTWLERPELFDRQHGLLFALLDDLRAV